MSAPQHFVSLRGARIQGRSTFDAGVGRITASLGSPVVPGLNVLEPLKVGIDTRARRALLLNPKGGRKMTGVRRNPDIETNEQGDVIVSRKATLASWDKFSREGEVPPEVIKREEKVFEGRTILRNPPGKKNPVMPWGARTSKAHPGEGAGLRGRKLGNNASAGRGDSSRNPGMKVGHSAKQEFSDGIGFLAFVDNKNVGRIYQELDEEYEGYYGPKYNRGYWVVEDDEHGNTTTVPTLREAKAVLKASLETGHFPRHTIGNPGRKKVGGRELSVPERHQLVIARRTLKMSDVGARVMGGPTKAEAREIIKRLTGRAPKDNPAQKLYGVFWGTKWGLTTSRKVAVERATKEKGHVYWVPYYKGDSWDAPTFRAVGTSIGYFG